MSETDNTTPAPAAPTHASIHQLIKDEIAEIKANAVPWFKSHQFYAGMIVGGLVMALLCIVL